MPIRRSLFLPLLALAWATLAAGPVWAQDAPVYRCGNSYSAKPCVGATRVDAADPRSDAQRREALAAQQADAKLARQMAADRRTAERDAARDAARNGGAANIGPRAAAVPAKPASAAARHAKKAKTLKLKPPRAGKRAAAAKPP